MIPIQAVAQPIANLRTVIDFVEPLKGLDLKGTWKDLQNIKQNSSQWITKSQASQQFTTKTQADKIKSDLGRTIKDAKASSQKEIAESLKRDFNLDEIKKDAEIQRKAFNDQQKKFDRAAQAYDKKIDAAASAAAAANANATIALNTAISAKAAIAVILATLAGLAGVWVLANELRRAINNLENMIIRGDNQLGDFILSIYRKLLDRLGNVDFRIDSTNREVNWIRNNMPKVVIVEKPVITERVVKVREPVITERVVRVTEKVPFAVTNTVKITDVRTVPVDRVQVVPVTNTVRITDVRTVPVDRVQVVPVTNTVRITDVRTVPVPKPYPVTNTVRTNTVRETNTVKTNTINLVKTNTNTIVKTVPITNTNTITKIQPAPLSANDLTKIRTATCQAIQTCTPKTEQGDGSGLDLEDIKKMAANIIIDNRVGLASLGEVLTVASNNLAELMNQTREQHLLDFDSYGYKYPAESVVIPNIDPFNVIQRDPLVIALYREGLEQAKADLETVKTEAIADSVETITERRIDSEAPVSLDKLPYLYEFEENNAST